MTVGELIEILKTKDQNKEVYIDSNEAIELKNVVDGKEDYCGTDSIILSI